MSNTKQTMDPHSYLRIVWKRKTHVPDPGVFPRSTSFSVSLLLSLPARASWNVPSGDTHTRFLSSAKHGQHNRFSDHSYNKLVRSMDGPEVQVSGGESAPPPPLCQEPNSKQTWSRHSINNSNPSHKCFLKERFTTTDK